jgi:hypothetical protein
VDVSIDRTPGVRVVNYACVHAASTSRWTSGRRSIGDEAVTALLAICLVSCAGLLGCALHCLQLRVEQWDYDRHAND